MKKLIPAAIVLLAAVVGCSSSDGSEVKVPSQQQNSVTADGNTTSTETPMMSGADEWACNFFGKQTEKDLKTTETTTLLLTGEDGKPGAMFSEKKSVHDAAKNLARAAENIRDGVSVPDWNKRMQKMKAACS